MELELGIQSSTMNFSNHYIGSLQYQQLCFGFAELDGFISSLVASHRKSSNRF
jgi:hypothetical protein